MLFVVGRLTEPNPMIESRMIIGGTSYYDNIIDQHGVGSKGSDRITSCGIDHQKNVLYYIGSNEFTGTQGEVRFESGFLSLNTDSDTVADSIIKLNGITAFTGDFLIL